METETIKPKGHNGTIILKFYKKYRKNLQGYLWENININKNYFYKLTVSVMNMGPNKKGNYKKKYYMHINLTKVQIISLKAQLDRCLKEISKRELENLKKQKEMV